MILFQKDISYVNRVSSKMTFTVIIVIIMCGLFWVATNNRSNWLTSLFYCIPLAIFLNALFGSIRSSIEWISLIEVGEQNSCHIIIMRKNIVYKDINVAANELRFELKPFAGRYTYYKMLVYLNNEALSVQCEVDDWDRYKMQKVVQYFHPEDKMAKKKKL